VQDFDTPLLPCGFVMKLILLNSWGDLHYVGLTGIELVDAVQGPVKVTPLPPFSTGPRASPKEWVFSQFDILCWDTINEAIRIYSVATSLLSALFHFENSRRLIFLGCDGA
jgi:hypothetical protein